MSFAVPQQHGGVTALLVRGHDIELPIVVELGDRNAARRGTGREMQVAGRKCGNAASRGD